MTKTSALFSLFAAISVINACNAQYIYSYPPPQQQHPASQLRTPYGLPQPGVNVPVMNGRQQRSLFGGGGGGGGWSGGGWSGGGGWNGGGIGISPIGVDHITKDELIALVEAWKEVEKNEPAKQPEPEPEPAKEPEPEPEAEPEPEPEPEEEEEEAAAAPPEEPAPAGPAPAGPPPGVPLTVSLPAFVPIQLSAMYTAPVPIGGAAIATVTGGGSGGGGGGGGGMAAAMEMQAADAGGADEGATEEAKARAFFKYMSNQAANRNFIGRTRAKPKAAAFKSTTKSGSNAARKTTAGSLRRLNNPAIRFPIQNPRSFASANYVASKPRFYRTPAPLPTSSSNTQPQSMPVLPPPSFLANAPGPLQFVPSSELMSSWR